MADVYLNAKNDRRAYARTYHDLVENNPTVESFVVLGEAYVSIQEVSISPSMSPFSHECLFFF